MKHDNVPNWPIEVAEAMLDGSLDVPSILVEELNTMDNREEQVRLYESYSGVLSSDGHFYIEHLKPFWDLDFRGIDLSKVRFPFPVTGLFYNFTNEKVGMPPVKARDPNDFEHGKTVLLVADLWEAQKIAVWGVTENPIPSMGDWMLLPVSAVFYRDNMEDMSQVITKTHIRAQMTAPFVGVNYDSYIKRLGQFENLSEVRLADMLSDHLKIVMGFLALSAAKNVPTYRTAAPEKLNKKRIKRGKLPLQSYHVLDLGLGKSRTVTTYDEPPQGERTRASPRLHLVRGHMRQLGSGDLTYVSPHVRGDRSMGQVRKDYRY